MCEACNRAVSSGLEECPICGKEFYRCPSCGHPRLEPFNPSLSANKQSTLSEVMAEIQTKQHQSKYGLFAIDIINLEKILSRYFA